MFQNTNVVPIVLGLHFVKESSLDAIGLAVVSWLEEI